MNPSDWNLVKTKFDVIAASPPEERRRVLSKLQREDPAMYGQVTRLLENHDDADSFLECSETVREKNNQFFEAIAKLADCDYLHDELDGYEILGTLGRGATSVAYRARQIQPQRDVAIKVLHPFIASDSLICRHKFEAEILAKLNHPGRAIASNWSDW